MREVALVGQRDLARDVVGRRSERDDGVSVREADRPPVGAGTPFLHSGNGGRCQVAEEVVRAERSPEGQPQEQGPGSRRDKLLHPTLRALTSPAGGVSAKLCRRQGEDLLDRVIERANGGKPGRQGDLTQGQGTRLNEHPCRLGSLGSSQGKRTGPDLGGELTLDLANAVAQSAGQSGNSLTINDTIRDEAHGSSDQV